MSERPTPEEIHKVCKYIAEMANAMGHQSGVPGLEVAGITVSVCATDPVFAEAFAKKGNGAIIDADKETYCAIFNGCLSYRAINDEILHPFEARERMGVKTQ